jgi:hypothetical protein
MNPIVVSDPQRPPGWRKVMQQLRAFLALFAFGLLGIAALYPSLGSAVAALRSTGNPPSMSDGALRTLMLVQPITLLLIATMVGLLVAHRVGLHSHVVDWATGAPSGSVLAKDLWWPVGAGLVSAIVIVGGDWVFSALADRSWASLRVDPAKSGSTLLLGLFYGGVTEEILLRWGLMSLIAWGLFKLGLAQQPAILAAIVISALLFGVSHLPAVANVMPLDGLLIVRTIVLNMVPGVLFGLVFWVHGLEFAMAAHALTHVFMFVARSLNLTF